MSQPGAADRIKKKYEGGTGRSEGRLLDLGHAWFIVHGGGALEDDQSQRRMLERLRGGTEMTLG